MPKALAHKEEAGGGVDVRVIVRAQVTKVDLCICIDVIGRCSLADPSRMSAPELRFHKMHSRHTMHLCEPVKSFEVFVQ